MTIRWTTAFWDLPARGFEAATEFWLDVTRSTLSEFRGPERDFATLIPPGTDPYLRVQRVRSGPGGGHLDLHVDDVVREARRAEDLGAEVLREEEELIVMRSPGGFAFCVVDYHGESAPPEPVFSPAGQFSVVDQVCLDIQPRRYDIETAFWERLTGRERVATGSAEFERLERPPDQPLRILLQRLETDEPGRPVRMHIDLACDDVDAEADRHRALGARPGERFDGWRVMADPAGLQYCVTGRDPRSGKVRMSD